MPEADFIKTDILIIGSGLAGLRAGISALEKNPEASVLLVTKGSGPVGSSFSNINNALGIQVCLSSEEKEAFVRDALAIARPGFIDPELTRIMAEESEACFRFLQAHGFEFNKDQNGRLIRYPGCFCPDAKRAFIFQNLAKAFHKLKTKFISLSGTYIENQSAIHLLTGKDGKNVAGALFISEKNKRLTVTGALSTIIASGGTSPLFKWNVGGRAISGYSPALLKRAGAGIVNATFHQFIWHHPFSNKPVSPFEYLKKNAFIRLSTGARTKTPDSILSLIPERTRHVPAGYAFPDNALDCFFLNHADQNGIVTFVGQDQQTRPAVLSAHAWNGGATIDPDGRTAVPGLYACGECAGGMHGANRLGGAMVLATQVFGRRAGKHAAEYLADSQPPDMKQCMDAANAFIENSEINEKVTIPENLGKDLYQQALYTLCGRKNEKKEKKKYETTGNIIRDLLSESALIITGCDDCLRRPCRGLNF